jgi:hypothetical protein
MDCLGNTVDSRTLYSVKVGPVLAKADRDRAGGVEEELVDLGPAWSAEEDEEEGNAGAAAPSTTRSSTVRTL